MATPTKSGVPGSEAAKIAEEVMPGWQAVAPTGPVRAFGAARPEGADTAALSSPSVDAVMPSTEELHRKFFGSAGADAVTEKTSDQPLADGTEIVEMKSGDLHRSVGVNRRTKKVEWTQG
jgi:hypothetical protein